VRIIVVWYVVASALAVLGLTGAAAADADAKDVVREITLLKGKVPVPRDGRATMPTLIEDEAALKKTFSDAEVAAAIQKHVDFTKEKLVFFAWSGSGQDRVSASLDPLAAQLTVVFKYTPGLTRDFRRHARLFAIPKTAVYRVENAR